jgi:hypothetical protein
MLAYIVGFFGEMINPQQKILTLSFMALLVHQFEEYGIPGGFPAIYNIAMVGGTEAPERYPLNQKSAAVVNVIGGYSFYIAAIFLPNLIWLGIAQILFGMAQIIVHGIIINVKMKSFYNPGLGAVVFLHWPIGIYFIWYITANGLVQGLDWIGGIVCTVAAAILIIALPTKMLRNKNSEYPFSKEEMEHFHMKEKLAKLRGK